MSAIVTCSDGQLLLKVTMLPLSLFKKKRVKLLLQLLQNKVVNNFEVQTTTIFVKKGLMIFSVGSS